ncbi:MAG: mechanosensitive ion channel family protein [Phycisphaeraceae bacterium]|nr:mechanosensitive ion channel family protein [Phycisphaeraceae bacterium]
MRRPIRWIVPLSLLANSVAYAAEQAVTEAPDVQPPPDPTPVPIASSLMQTLGPTFQETHWWQWAALAVCIFLGLLAGKITSTILRSIGDKLISRNWHIRGTVFNNLASPISLALFSVGIYGGLVGFIQLHELKESFVDPLGQFLLLLALAWLLYNLVDVIDVLLRRLTEKTENKIGDMILPLIRKTLRVFLVIVFALVIAQNVFGMNVTGFLAGLGIAGLAVSLAAQDSVKNLFGSLTIFFDKPFLIGDFVTFDGQSGTVEEIGFRSTRIRLLSGHLVTIPNMKFIDTKAENVSARPYIRREMNVTITYDTPPEKIEQAVSILREILHDQQVVSEGMFDMENNPPRVAFNELNADSLNIRAYYWYVIPRRSERGFFTFLEHCQLVNMMLFRRFTEASIDFAFPTQTLYLAGDDKRQLTVDVRQVAKNSQ